MAKTFNLTPPAAAFISQPIPAPAAAVPEGVPAGYVLKQESKSKRLNILIRPSTHARLSRLAADAAAISGAKISVNDLINRMLEECLDSTDASQLARSISDSEQK